MTLEEKVNSELVKAMKAKDKARLRGLRAIKSAIMLRKTDGSGTDVSPEEEIKILQKLVKQRQESMEIYKQQKRDDLANVEEEEIIVIEEFLPEQMNEEDLKKFIQQIIQDTGAEGMKDMGKVMGLASKELSGRADGKTISTIVKSLLQ